MQPLSYFQDLLLSMIILGPVYFYLERKFPMVPGKRRFSWKDGLENIFWQWLDTYGEVYLTSFMQGAIYFCGIFFWKSVLGHHRNWNPSGAGLHLNAHNFGGVVPQVIIAYLFWELWRYFVHRSFHRIPLLWRLHILHHSSEEMNWLSTTRTHILEGGVDTLLVQWVLVFFGVPNWMILGIGIYETQFGLLEHSNIRVSWGRFDKWFTSTLVHHWHHAAECHSKGGQNFGAFLTIWDRVFGTFYVGENGEPPTRYGVAPGNQYPRSFLARAIYPLYNIEPLENYLKQKFRKVA